jgi:hypothetical protein
VAHTDVAEVAMTSELQQNSYVITGRDITTDTVPLQRAGNEHSKQHVMVFFKAAGNLSALQEPMFRRNAAPPSSE